MITPCKAHTLAPMVGNSDEREWKTRKAHRRSSRRARLEEGPSRDDRPERCSYRRRGNRQRPSRLRAVARQGPRRHRRSEEGHCWPPECPDASRTVRARSTKFDFDGYRMPFLYSTKGEVFWFQNVRPPEWALALLYFAAPFATNNLLSRRSRSGQMTTTRGERLIQDLVAIIVPTILAA